MLKVYPVRVREKVRQWISGMIYHTILLSPGLTALSPFNAPLFIWSLPFPSWSVLEHCVSLYKHSFCLANRPHIPLIAAARETSQAIHFFRKCAGEHMRGTQSRALSRQACSPPSGAGECLCAPIAHLWKTSLAFQMICLSSWWTKEQWLYIL